MWDQSLSRVPRHKILENLSISAGDIAAKTQLQDPFVSLTLSLSPLVKDNIFWICHFRGIFWDKLDTDYKLPGFCESKRLKLPNLGGDLTLN